MPGAPRKEIFDPDTVGVYHCYNRCSQRARLCGFDPVTETDFSHRKEWIRDRLKELAGVMANPGASGTDYRAASNRP